MPTIRVEMTHDEFDMLRRCADADGLSLEECAHNMLMAAVRDDMAMSSAAHVMRLSDDLLRKLADS